MSHVPAILVACGACLVNGCASLAERLDSAQTPDAISQATADHYVHDLGDESCAVALVMPDRTCWGFAGNAHQHSLFRIASLTKIFIHIAVVRMAQEGRIDLDRTVDSSSKLDLPPDFHGLTIRDLMLNRSGLPREFLAPWNPLDVWSALSCGLFGTNLYADFDTRSEFVHVLWRPWWRRTLRERHETYSNVGYGLLGMTLEDLQGTSLETIIRNEVGRPLGLTETAFESSADGNGRLTRACAGDVPWLARRGTDVPDHRLGEALRASGGLLSSISDCARAFSAYWPILDAQLRAQPIDTAENDAVSGALRVWILPSGHRILYRAGMIYGGSSFVGFDPDAHTIIVILRNVTSWPDALGFQVMERLHTQGRK